MGEFTQLVGLWTYYGRPLPFDALAWTAAALNIVGVLLLALNVVLSPWGWVLCLIGSSAWLLWAVRNDVPSQLVMQIVISVVNVVGVARWVL